MVFRDDGVPPAIAIDAFELWRELRSQAANELDALLMAEQGATGGIEVSPEARRASDERLNRGRVRVGRVHLPLETLELREGEIGGAAQRGGGLHPRAARGERGWGEGHSACTSEVSDEDIRGGVQVALGVAADELGVLGEGHVALEDARPHPTARFVGLLGVLWELQARPTVPDREVMMRIPLNVGHACHKFVPELAFFHPVDQVERRGPSCTVL